MNFIFLFYIFFNIYHIHLYSQYLFLNASNAMQSGHMKTAVFCRKDSAFSPVDLIWMTEILLKLSFNTDDIEN